MTASTYQAQGGYMDLSGAELATIITASTVGAAALFRPAGAFVKWLFSSRLSREQWVEDRVRKAFADIERTASSANDRADALTRRVDALESDKMNLVAISQALVFELTRLDPASSVLDRAQRLLDRVLDSEAPRGGIGL